MQLFGQQKGEVRVPRTRAELDALIARRGELQGQLRTSEDRRFQLSQQAQATPPESRGALNQRLATLDERIAQIEAQVLQLDNAISQGMSNADLIHSADQLTPPPTLPPPGFPFPPSPEAVIHVAPPGAAIPVNGRTLLVGGLGTLALFALVSWLMWRRAVASLTRSLRPSATSSTDMSQLQRSVDAIAVEVERISENQRFVTKLLNQQAPGVVPSVAAESGAARDRQQVQARSDE